MSYDISLYPRQPGQDWDQVLAADEALDPDGDGGSQAELDAAVATFARIESRVSLFLPGEQDSWVAEETGGDVYGELVDSATGLQVDLYHGSAAVTFPYWQHEDAQTFYRRVAEVVRIVAEETGYQAYDNQTGTDFVAVDEGRVGSAMETLAEVGALTVAGQSSTDAQDDEEELDPRAARAKAREEILKARMEAARDPQLVRRRAKFDIFLGIAMVTFGLWSRTQGSEGWLNLLVLVVGGMTLIGGVVGLRTAAKLAAEKDKEQGQGHSGPEGITHL